MPKTTKRAATRRAAKIAKAHATQLPKFEVKEAPPRRPIPGYRPPARGLARYPWAVSLTVLLVALGLYSLYYYHVGPFALPKLPPKTGIGAPCLSANVLKQITDLSPAPGEATFNITPHHFDQAPPMSIDTKKVYCAGINTNRGLVVVELDPNLAPQTVNNFVFLAQRHFYDGLVFHRVLKGSGNQIIQTGDPLGKDLQKRGTGGPGYKFPDEPVKGDYTAGAVAMANAGPNTNGSQFFICTANDTFPKQYNLFGHVVKGLDVAKSVQGPGDDAASKNIQPDIIDHLIVVAAP